MLQIAIATSKHQLPPSDDELRIALIQHGTAVTPVLWSSTVDWRRFDAVLVRSCWDYHLRANEFLDWIAVLENYGLTVVNSPALIRWNFSKLYLKELSEFGFRIPKTVWIDTGVEVDLAGLCTSHGWRTAVVKPLVSASAYRTERRSTGIVRGPAMVQEYLTSIETEGEWSLMYFAGEFSHAVRKTPARDDFRVQMEFGGTVHASDPPEFLRVFAGAALARLPFPAVIARIDVVANLGNPILMELEAIEPELFLAEAPGSDRRAARAVMKELVKAT